MVIRDESKQNITVIGAGATGLFIAERLATLSEVTVTLAVSTRHHTLLTSSPLRGVTVLPLLDITSFPGPIIVCVKAYDLDLVLKTIAPYLTRTSPLLLCQNGLSIFFQAFETIRHTAPILRGLLNFGVRKLSDTSVELSGTPSIALAALPQDEFHLEQFQKLFLDAGWGVTIEKDIATAEWKKALINIVVNPLCTILDAPNIALLENRDAFEQGKKILAEVRRVALKDGFPLEDVTESEIFESIRRFGSNINSHLADRRAGKKTEIEYIMGRYLRLAEQYGIEVPHSKRVYDEFCRLA